MANLRHGEAPSHQSRPLQTRPLLTHQPEFRGRRRTRRTTRRRTQTCVSCSHSVRPRMPWCAEPRLQPLMQTAKDELASSLLTTARLSRPRRATWVSAMAIRDGMGHRLSKSASTAAEGVDVKTHRPRHQSASAGRSRLFGGHGRQRPHHQRPPHPPGRPLRRVLRMIASGLS